MARKDFHFEFDEDADPVEELHRLRVAVTRRFKTMDAIMEYHRAAPSIEEIKGRLKAEIVRKEMQSTRPRKIKTVQKAAGRRKTVKRPDKAAVL